MFCFILGVFPHDEQQYEWWTDIHEQYEQLYEHVHQWEYDLRFF